MNEKFLNKIIEFEKEENLDKFNTKNKTIKFSDGTFMSAWWSRNKSEFRFLIFDEAISIKKQYSEYRRRPKFSKSFTNRLKEFANEPCMQKFNTSDRSLLFSDGGIMSTWWNSLSSKILNLQTPDALAINLQYKEYMDNNTFANVKKRYYEKLKEFKQEENLNKFKPNNDLRFKDNTLMNAWFKNHYFKIISSNDDVSKSIMMQYKKFCEEQKRRLSFEEKLLEFEREEDLQKFNKNNKTIKFTDGCIKSNYWNSNKKRIYSLNNVISKSIIKQHEDYKKYY